MDGTMRWCFSRWYVESLWGFPAAGQVRLNRVSQVFAIGQTVVVSLQVNQGGLGQEIASVGRAQIELFEKVSLPLISRSSIFQGRKAKGTRAHSYSPQPPRANIRSVSWSNLSIGPICFRHALHLGTVLFEAFLPCVYRPPDARSDSASMEQSDIDIGAGLGNDRSVRNRFPMRLTGSLGYHSRKVL